MTPNLRLEKNQRLRTALRQKLVDVHSSLLKNTRNIPNMEQQKKQPMEMRNYLEA